MFASGGVGWWLKTTKHAYEMERETQRAIRDLRRHR
jgi:hypothetical protein